MKIIQPARLQWTAANEPFASDFADVYFSAVDGYAETQYVFLEGNQLPGRWRSLAEKQFVIGETGFGSGLNFIAAWKLWEATAPADAHLTFVSAEQFPLTREDLARASARWPELKPYYDQLLSHYPVLTAGFHLLHFHRVTLLLLLGDATEMYSQLDARIDAWFLDGFAPAKNPQLWSADLFAEIARLSAAGASAATFTAAGEVRRHLAAAGFSVQKQKGFGHKREMVVAHSIKEKGTDLFSPGKNRSVPFSREVTVLGAGIAGACVAQALAQAGMAVTVIDAQSAPAREASGNRQAILYGKFSARDDAFAQFNRSSYLHALHFYRQLSQQHPELPIHHCGVLQMAWNEKETKLQQELASFLAHHPGIARPVEAEEASALAGIDLPHPALYFPDAGWLHPAAVCQQLLQHPAIHTRFNTPVTSLQFEMRPGEKGTWHLLDAEGNSVHHCQQLVLATGHQSTQFDQTRTLPLRRIRGQVSHVTPTAHSRRLRCVISGDGYIAPVHPLADTEWQSLGASYTPKDFELVLKAEEHADNLRRLGHHAPSLQAEWQAGDIDEGRAHFRAATRDFFPLCGPVLSGQPGQDGLWICAGLGSRGMSYAPLCAEVIRSQVTGTAAPLPSAVMQALDPRRFEK